LARHIFYVVGYSSFFHFGLSDMGAGRRPYEMISSLLTALWRAVEPPERLHLDRLKMLKTLTPALSRHTGRGGKKKDGV
jgi:hypothetical protein